MKSYIEVTRLSTGEKETVESDDDEKDDGKDDLIEGLAEIHKE